MLKLGCHVQMAAPLYLEGSVKQALEFGANTFMFYTGAPTNTIRKEIETKYNEKAHQLMLENNIDIKEKFLI